MINRFDFRLPAWLAAIGASVLLLVGAVNADSQPASSDDGLRIFKSANCMGCHKWSGIGGGGYGGAAANLRQTALSMEQLEQTIGCGRPGTGMPHFEADAYTDGHCYGLKSSDLPDGKLPPEPDHYLRRPDILAVATYVMTSIKGKGEPDFAQCRAFFGTDSRVCNTYPKAGGGQMALGSGSSDSSAQSIGHLKVEAAPDANASRSVGR